MIARLLVSFFLLWHGKLHLRGAGRILIWAAAWDQNLRSFPLRIPRIGKTMVDFRDRSSLCWMGYLLGNRLQEESQLVVIRKFLQPGMVFWDIGANVGIVSALVFVNFPTVRIVAIEPNPSLANNLKLLFWNHEHVVILNRALSDTDREAPFFIPRGAGFNGSLKISKSDPGEIVQVQVSRGDSLLEELSRLSPPALVKIDVEGHEASVFAGLKRVILDNRPIIIFEHDHLTEEKIDEITPPGYDRFSIHDQSGDLIEGIDRRSSHNSVLIPRIVTSTPLTT